MHSRLKKLQKEGNEKVEIEKKEMHFKPIFNTHNLHLSFRLCKDVDAANEVLREIFAKDPSGFSENVTVNNNLRTIVIRFLKWNDAMEIPEILKEEGCGPEAITMFLF